jgi:hypothetical protein
MSEPAEKPEAQVVKKTFEFCLSQQERLRDTLEMLIQEDRCLTDAERGPFILQLSRATFGMGREAPFRFMVEDQMGLERLGSVEHMARDLAAQRKNPVVFTRKYIDSSDKYAVEVPIKKLWETLLSSLYDIFALALDKASSMSKESDASLGSDTHQFRPGG